MAKSLDINKTKADTGITSGEVSANMERSETNRGQQTTASAEEKEKRQSQLRTKGRKGCKLDRLNLSISPENIQFIKVMSAIMGKTNSEFANFIFDQYREENAADYEAAKDIVDRLSNSKLAKRGK